MNNQVTIELDGIGSVDLTVAEASKVLLDITEEFRRIDAERVDWEPTPKTQAVQSFRNGPLHSQRIVMVENIYDDTALVRYDGRWDCCPVSELSAMPIELLVPNHSPLETST